MSINDANRKMTVSIIKEIRAKEREKFQSKQHLPKGEFPIYDANARLYRHFKSMDLFNASSLTRSCMKVAR